MKIKEFKSHIITRSNPPHKSIYQQYKPFLKHDFCGRCAYCNLKDSAITTYFEVDHFIPRATFMRGRMDLLTDYQNLVYACKKCNSAKGSKFKGDITLDKPVNEQFYDPVLVDYNTVFYRNELGLIASDDEKGKRQINDLKLYRPIHSLAWLCEELENTRNMLESIIKSETNPTRKEKLKEAYNKINETHSKMLPLFIASYNNDGFDFTTEPEEKELISAGNCL